MSIKLQGQLPGEYFVVRPHAWYTSVLLHTHVILDGAPAESVQLVDALFPQVNANLWTEDEDNLLHIILRGNLELLQLILFVWDQCSGELTM